MSAFVPEFLSRYLFYPLWDLYDRSLKLQEWRRLEKTQWASHDQREREQKRRLAEIVQYATKNCPYYGHTRYTFFSQPEQFHRLPILTKDDIRRNGRRMISQEFKTASLITAKTGGSTGTSLEVRFDKRCEEFRNAAAMRSDKWSGWRPGMIRGALWGNPPVASTLKERVRASCLDRMVFLDTVTMSDDAMSKFVADVRRFNIKTLYGHAHSLYILAAYVQANEQAPLPMRAIISTSMMLLPQERSVIEQVFQCRATNRYGCEEVGLIACECQEHNGMHLNTDHLFIEFLRDDGTEAEPGEEARIVVTDLINRGMPLIRYAVGDVGVKSNRVCPCGRGLPLMEKVVGRTADFLVKTDGSLVAGVSLVERTLTAIPGLAQLQIIQEKADELILNVVPDGRYGENTEQKLKEELSSVFGEIQFKINRGAKIEMEKNGKYRFSICRVKSRYQDTREKLVGAAS